MARIPSSLDLRDRERMERRDFLKVAAAGGAAVGAAGATGAGIAALVGVPSLAAQSAPISVPRFPQEAAPVLLGNGEPPALQFQAYPGGTGALLEKLWRETGGNPFVRERMDVEPWTGPVPSTAEDLVFQPVHRLSALIRGRHVSPTELFEVYMERLVRLDPVLMCAVTILEGRGREEAEQAEAEIRAGDWRGPLHGIPYGVKDLFSIRGVRTTWGSSDFENRIIDVDSEVVLRLREAGAVLIAKLSTGEFARGDRWFRGRTRNPWNTEEGSSGSSAGPASATAAGCVAFGIGTETQGSIVSPARRCGLSALRPTFGRVSRYGGMVLSWSMDKTGPICRTIEDCALVFDAIHGADEKDPASLTTPFRFNRTLDLSTVRIGFTEDAPQSFVEKLRELGADPQPVFEIPDGGSNALGVESAAAFDFHVAPGGELPEIPDDLPDAERSRRGRFRGSRDVLALDFVQGQRRRHLLMREMAGAMEGYDMFVSGSGHVRLTNQTGHPAAVVQYDFGLRDPEGDDQQPQPLTTTLIGSLFADDKILSVAHAFQKATKWHTRRPTIA